PSSLGRSGSVTGGGSASLPTAAGGGGKSGSKSGQPSAFSSSSPVMSSEGLAPGAGGETAKAGQAKTAPPSANAAPILIKGCTICFGLLEGDRRSSFLGVRLGADCRNSTAMTDSPSSSPAPPLDPSCRYL